MISSPKPAEGAAVPEAGAKPLYPPRSYQKDLVDLAVNNNVGAAVLSSRWVTSALPSLHMPPVCTVQRIVVWLPSVTQRVLCFGACFLAIPDYLHWCTAAGHHLTGHK